MRRSVATMRWGRQTLWLAAMGIGLCALTAAADMLHWRLGGWVLLGSFAIGTFCAFTAGRLASLADQSVALPVILIAAAAMRLALLFSEPTLSSDIYRYIWDGRVQASGTNPYRYVPAASELVPLRDPDIWAHINRAGHVTIYPPVAQSVFFAVTRFGESVVTMKIGLLLFEAVGVAAIIALLQQLGKPATHVAAYAWHPLPIWEVAGNGHVDAVMCTFLLLGLLVCLGGRTLLAGVVVSLGALVKPTALLALPVFWRPWRIWLPLLFLATIALLYAPYLAVGWKVLGFLPAYVAEEGLDKGYGFRLVMIVYQIFGVVPYLDIPVQHVATDVLRAMRRGTQWLYANRAGASAIAAREISMPRRASISDCR